MTARGCIILLLIGGAAAAREHRPPVRGKVRYATARRAYLDAGRLEGFHAGDVVKLTRGKITIDCKLDQIADHASSCPAEARVGDAFSLPPPPAPVAAPPPPAVVAFDPSAQSRLVDSEFVKVDFHPSGARAGGGALPLVTVDLGHTAFVTFNGGQFQQERLELALDGLNMRFGGFRAYGHLTALVYSEEPSATRFRKNDIFQLYVWDLEASSREIGRSWTFSAGRVAPYHAPGLTMLDGVQVGWRSKSGDAEVGVLGGTLPSAMTLYPSARWIGGLYYGATHAGGRKSVLRLFRHEARLDVRDTAQGPQLELEGLMQAWITRWVDLGAQTRASLGAGDWSTVRFEAARASMGLHPVNVPVRAYAEFRYLDARTSDPDVLTASLFSTGRWYYGNADVAWDIRKWVSFSLHGGIAKRTDAPLGREYVGGELAFPTLFRGKGGVSLGYQEELGWIAGRTASLQLNGSVADKLRVLARLAYFEDDLGHDNVGRELGLYLSIDGRIVRWLSLRLSAMTRVALSDVNLGAAMAGKASLPAGLVGRAELVGSY